MKKRLVSIAISIVVFVALVGMIAPVQAQVTYRVWGQVFDTNGVTAVDGVDVTVTDINTGDSLSTTTAGGGYYQAVFGVPATTNPVTIGDTLEIVATYGALTNTTTVTATGSPQRVDLILQEETAPTCTVSITNTTIEPPQTTDIHVEFSERVDYVIKIETDTGVVVYDWAGTRSTPITKTWDGSYEVDGIYTVNVTMESTTTGLTGYNDTQTITVTSAPRSVELTVVEPADKTTSPNVSVTYNFTVKNTGTVEDSYNLTVDAGGAETVVLNRTEIENLGSEATAGVLLTVEDSMIGVYVVNVTVTSQTDETVTDSKSTTTTVAIQYTLTILSTAGGSVTVPGEGAFIRAEDEVVNLEAVADSRYKFDKWTGNVGEIVDVDAKETTIRMNADYTITANFKRTYIGGGGAPKDSDGDGYSDIQEMLAGTDKNDPCDPNPECAACSKPAATPTAAPTAAPTAKPTTPPAPTPKPTAEPTPTPTEEPGFEAVFAIAGLLAVAYLVLRRKSK